MSIVEVNCPGCGAQVVFKIPGSVVTVCEYCKSVVARGDRAIEDLGKVADLADTQSPLQLGLKGAYQGAWFELTGRAQLGHEAGSMWDEWYAAFSDGRWGWLAEAQGRFYMTFQVSLPPNEGEIPSLDRLELGQGVPAIPGQVPMMVAEKGEARALSAKGEIPYRLVPGQTYYYADLSGPHGEFGTLDFSETPPLVFLGKEVTLAEMGFPELAAAAQEAQARHVAAVHLFCPNCGGPLDLRAPDITERVTCPNCGSLLDVNSGQLKFLKALQPGKVAPVITLGAVGEIGGGRFMAIGFMQRSVEFEHIRYYWEEYLLYNPQIGFRWLVRSDDHWDFVETVSPGSVTCTSKLAAYNNLQFKIYQSSLARVEYVFGEFYWKVTVGELTKTTDFVHPPYVLSQEVSVSYGQGSGGHHKPIEGSEINWSLGTYVTPDTIEKAFGTPKLPRPSKPAPNQVFPHKAIYKYWGWMMLAVFVLGLIINIAAPRQKVFEQSYSLQPVANATATQVIFTDPFPLKAGRNIKVTASAPGVSNSWLYIDGDFVSDATGLVQTFPLPVEYYFGSDSDGSWSEGSSTADVNISALPGDNYNMRLEIQWEQWQQPMALTVRVEQGVPSLGHMFLVMLVISIIPMLVAIYHLIFARRRWDDSPYSPFQQK